MDAMTSYGVYKFSHVNSKAGAHLTVPAEVYRALEAKEYTHAELFLTEEGLLYKPVKRTAPRTAEIPEWGEG